jgi:hypothetical protein
MMLILPLPSFASNALVALFSYSTSPLVDDLKIHYAIPCGLAAGSSSVAVIFRNATTAAIAARRPY